MNKKEIIIISYNICLLKWNSKPETKNHWRFKWNSNEEHRYEYSDY